MKRKDRIAIVNPSVPHYREEFYLGIKEMQCCDVFTYEDKVSKSKSNFKVSEVNTKKLRKITCNKFLLFSISPLLNRQYHTLVLMWDFAQLSTWFLLLTKFIHHKRIILWGQGISVKRYIEEEKQPNKLLKWMLYLADGAWIYMEKETVQWKQIFPKKKIVALKNTISYINDILLIEAPTDKHTLKERHGIKEEICLIFCARFENPNRRVDLLLELIKNIDNGKYGFIVIGAGRFKPDFAVYKNVYDYGSLYDKAIKDELFAIADIYFQPGWLGLSVVEAMAYGKPIMTFKRSKLTMQCVEYEYVIDGYNGLIIDDMNDLINRLKQLNKSEISRLGENAKYFVKSNLLMENMINNALSVINI